MPSPFDVDKTDLMENTLERLDVRFSRSKRGWQKVSCPSEFHARGDRNPSASVNLSLGKFHCHGCGLHGDGFDLLMAVEGIRAAAVVEGLDLTRGTGSGSIPEWII